MVGAKILVFFSRLSYPQKSQNIWLIDKISASTLRLFNDRFGLKWAQNNSLPVGLCFQLVKISSKIVHFICSNLELYKEFAEEAYSVALHPSGLYILVGFSDKLRLMNLLIDDIRTFKELTVRGCREVLIYFKMIEYLSNYCNARTVCRQFFKLFRRLNADL